MKLILTVIHDRDHDKMAEALLSHNFRFTKVASTGGFLREGNMTFLVGVDDSHVDQVIALIGQTCKTREQFVNILPPDAAPLGTMVPSPVKVLVGGAIVFVLDVERFERY
ncbi:MAG: cyclic-di-AMP receptor [Armatimonadetes bacterium]|nr:cyclic-di-AMP receptor [Armatimonadota bacterium]